MVALSLGVALTLRHAEGVRQNARTPTVEPLQLAESLIATAHRLGHLEQRDQFRKSDVTHLPFKTEVVRTTLATALQKVAEDHAPTLTLSRLRDTLIDLYGASLPLSILNDLKNVVSDERDRPLPADWIEAITGMASMAGSMNVRRRDS